MTKNNTYKGHSLFNDVTDNTLQTYNRFVTSCNINNSLSKKNVKEYLAHFSETEQRKIHAMGQYISVVGAQEVARQINSGDLQAFVEGNKEALH